MRHTHTVYGYSLLTKLTSLKLITEHCTLPSYYGHFWLQKENMATAKGHVTMVMPFLHMQSMVFSYDFQQDHQYMIE